MPTATLPAPRTLPNADPRLDRIRAKVAAGERLSLADGDLLYTTPDIWTVCELADQVRRRLHGDIGLLQHQPPPQLLQHLRPLLQVLRVLPQAGRRRRVHPRHGLRPRRSPQGRRGRRHRDPLVGGLHPYLPFGYYTDLVRTIRETARELGSDLHVKAFTAVEIVHLAKIAKVYKADDRVAGIRHVLIRTQGSRPRLAPRRRRRSLRRPRPR